MGVVCSTCDLPLGLSILGDSTLGVAAVLGALDVGVVVAADALVVALGVALVAFLTGRFGSDAEI